MNVEQLIKEGVLEPVESEPGSYVFLCPIHVPGAAVEAGGFELFSGVPADGDPIAATVRKIQLYVIQVISDGIAAQVDRVSTAQKQALINQMIGEPGRRVLEEEEKARLKDRMKFIAQ